MIPYIFQSIDEIIKAATPEQKVIWQQIRLIVGENSAVQQMAYQGLLAGSEFLTYSANKLYLALQVAYGGTILGVNQFYIQYFDQTNTASFIDQPAGQEFYDGTAAATRFIAATGKMENIYFSRVSTNGTYQYIKFIGYKLTM